MLFHFNGGDCGGGDRSTGALAGRTDPVDDPGREGETDQKCGGEGRGLCDEAGNEQQVHQEHEHRYPDEGLDVVETEARRQALPEGTAVTHVAEYQALLHEEVAKGGWLPWPPTQRQGSAFPMPSMTAMIARLRTVPKAPTAANLDMRPNTGLREIFRNPRPICTDAGAGSPCVSSFNEEIAIFTVVLSSKNAAGASYCLQARHCGSPFTRGNGHRCGIWLVRCGCCGNCGISPPKTATDRWPDSGQGLVSLQQHLAGASERHPGQKKRALRNIGV